MEFSKGNVYRISQSHMKILFELFNVTNIEELRKKIDANVTPNLSENIDEEIKKANLRIKLATATIKEHEAKYIKEFGEKPSSQGRKAIKEYSTKPKPNEYIVKNYVVMYEDGKWKALCKKCEKLLEADTEKEATDDVIWHLEEIHRTKAEILVKATQ